MEWYQGTIPAAIQLARTKKVVFVVYISGNDEMSKEMDNSWNAESTTEISKSTGMVAIRIAADSDTCAQFSALFPVVIVPATYFIGNDGVPIEVVGGAKSVEELQGIIRRTTEAHVSKLGAQVPGPGASNGSGEMVSDSVGASSVNPIAGAAAATGHSSPGASAIAVEERARKARELMDEKRLQKTQKEKEDLLAKEKERRDQGKNLGKLKQRNDEHNAKEVQEQIRKDREENKAAKERIKEQIARDREERNKKYHQEKADRERVKDDAKIAKLKAEQEAKEKLASQRSKSAMIQFRMSDGSFVTQQFNSTDPLSTAQQFIAESLNRSPGSFRMCMAYPRREFTQNDMSQSMADLGLAPSAAVMILPPARGTTVARAEGGQGILAMLFSPVLAIWNFVYSLFFGRSTSTAGQRPTQESTTQPQSTGQSNPRKRPAPASRRDGNVHRLARDDDDEMNTWNGNSTQQM